MRRRSRTGAPGGALLLYGARAAAPASGNATAALVGLVRAVARRSPLLGFAVEAGCTAVARGLRAI